MAVVQRQVSGMIPQSPRVDLVVDVRDVARIGDMVRAVELTQQPEKHIENDGRTGVADMGEVVNGRAADI